MLASVLPPQAYGVVLEQIRRIAETSSQSLGWRLVLSIGIALWSVSNLTQVMFAAFNIAYEEPERRSINGSSNYRPPRTPLAAPRSLWASGVPLSPTMWRKA